MKKKELELYLSQLETFVRPNVRLEQYQTSSSIAADLLWDAYQKGHIREKTVADFGCGAGIFGLGALLLGAKKVFFVDIDKNALLLAKKNKIFLEKKMGKKYLTHFSCCSVADFSSKVFVVFQNPPFGVQNIHADRVFLDKAMEVGTFIYTFHKLSTQDFVAKIIEEKGFHVVEMYRYKFPLKVQFSFHTSKVKYIDAGCWGLEKN